MQGALSGLRVVDLSESIGGQYCARLFADYGADVVLVEPAAGSFVHRIGPFGRDGRSLHHVHLNTGKTVRRLQPGEAAEALPEVRRADLVVLPDAQGCDRIEAANPDAITVQVSAFGADGPWAHWHGPEIVLQALSGMMNSNGSAGREPLYGVGNRAAYAAGLAAYIAATAALLARRRGAPRQRVSVDAAETATTMCFPYVLQYLYNGTDRRRGDQDIPAGQVLCRGSWVCIWVYPHRFATLCRLLGLEACIDDPRFAESRARSQHWPEFFAIVQERVAEMEAEELVARLQEAEIISARAYRPSELVESPHLAARQYWERGPDGGVRLGPPFLLSATPRRQQPATAKLGVPEEALS